MKILTHGNLRKFPKEVISETINLLLTKYKTLPVYCISMKYNKTKTPNFNIKRHLTIFIKKKVKDPVITWNEVEHNSFTYISANYYSESALKRETVRKEIERCRISINDQNIEFLSKHDPTWLRANHFRIFKDNNKYDLIVADGVYQKIYTDVEEELVRTVTQFANVNLKVHHFTKFNPSTWLYEQIPVYQFSFRDPDKLAILKMLFD